MRAWTGEFTNCKQRGAAPASPPGPSFSHVAEKISAAVPSAKPPVRVIAPVEKTSVLVVDDEYGSRESIAFSLATEFAVDTAERAK